MGKSKILCFSYTDPYYILLHHRTAEGSQDLTQVPNAPVAASQTLILRTEVLAIGWQGTMNFCNLSKKAEGVDYMFGNKKEQSSIHPFSSLHLEM